MKGFINKRDKIKWEDNPFQPELTDERIKAGVDKYFPVGSEEPEQGDYLMWDEDHDIWTPHTPRIDDNTDVTTNNPEDGQILVYDTNEWNNITPVLNLADDVNITTPAEGDTLVYDATAEEWKNVAPATTPTWELLEEITADGTDRYATSSAFPAGVTGIMIDCIMEAGAAAGTVGGSVSTDGTNYTTIAGVGSGIDTSVKYFRIFYLKDSNMWIGSNTGAVGTINGAGTVQMRYDSVISFSTLDIHSVRVFAPSGDVIPAGSKISIYIKH